MKGLRWRPHQAKEDSGLRTDGFDRLLDPVTALAGRHVVRRKRKKRKSTASQKGRLCFCGNRETCGGTGFLRGERERVLIGIRHQLERKVAVGALPVRKSNLATPRQVWPDQSPNSPCGFGGFQITRTLSGRSRPAADATHELAEH